MLTFETRDGEVIATMKSCALTAKQGWTLFEGSLEAEEAAAVTIANNSGDLVLLGDKRRQTFLDSHADAILGAGSRRVTVTGHFLAGNEP
jgi:hypothetical protein